MGCAGHKTKARRCLYRLHRCKSRPSLDGMSRSFAPPFESFVAPARVRPQLWRLMIGLLVCAGMILFGSFGLLLGVGNLLGQPRAWVFEVMGGETVAHTHLILFSFIAMAAGPVLAAWYLHKRSAASLFGRGSWVIHDFAYAVLICAPLLGLNLLIWSLFYDAVPNLNLSLWWMALPLSLIGLFIQTGAEELLFRGYLQQQLAARFRSPLIWCLFPSLLFGLVHYDETLPGQTIWLVIAATGLFGLAAADLTARTGSIGAAWGFHFANNIAALTLVSLQGSLNAISLFVTPYTDKDADLFSLFVSDMLTTVVIWLILRRMLSR